MTRQQEPYRNLYIADLHFSHKGILKSRPFASVDEMNETLLRNWRMRVNPQDRVFILGDLFAWEKHPEHILERLTGRLTLIEGNHDAVFLRRIHPERYFEGVYQTLTVEDRGRRLRLTHIPDPALLTGDVDHLLYGHLHANPWRHSVFWPALRDAGPRALNVGLDVALAVGGFASPAPLEAWQAYNQMLKERIKT